MFVGGYVSPSKPSSDDMIIDKLFGLHRQSLPWSVGCREECPMVLFIFTSLTRVVGGMFWILVVFVIFTRYSDRLGLMRILMTGLGTNLRSRPD